MKRPENVVEEFAALPPVFWIKKFSAHLQLVCSESSSQFTHSKAQCHSCISCVFFFNTVHLFIPSPFPPAGTQVAAANAKGHRTDVARTHCGFNFVPTRKAESDLVSTWPPVRKKFLYDWTDRIRIFQLTCLYEKCLRWLGFFCLFFFTLFVYTICVNYLGLYKHS